MGSSKDVVQRTSTIVNSLATAFDVAYSPRLLGIEMLETIKALRCGRDAKIIESRTDAPSKASSDAAFLVSLWCSRTQELDLGFRRPGASC